MQKQNKTEVNWTLWIGLLILVLTELINSKVWALPKALYIILIVSSIIVLMVGLAFDVKKFLDLRKENNNNRRINYK